MLESQGFTAKLEQNKVHGVFIVVMRVRQVRMW